MNVNDTAMSENVRIFEMNISRTGSIVRSAFATGLIGQILIFNGTLPVQVPLALVGVFLASVAIMRWDPLIALLEWSSSHRAESPPLRFEKGSSTSQNQVGSIAEHHKQSASNDHRFSSDSMKAA